MQTLSKHPADQSEVGVLVEDASNLRLVLARIEPKQLRIDQPSLTEMAKEELALTEDQATKLRPLATSILSDSASAEEVMQSINQNEFPARERKALHSLLTCNNTMLADQKVLLSPPDVQPDSAFLIKGKDLHHLQIDPINTYRDDRQIEVRLMKVKSHCPLFSDDQIGRKDLKLKVPNFGDLRMLSTASSFGLMVDVEAKINVKLTAKGAEYSGLVIKVIKSPEFLKALKQAKEAEDQDLFRQID